MDMASLASLETLVTEQTAHFYAQGTATEARAESRLFDAAVDCGMAWDHDDLHGWVAERVGEFLTSGPSLDDADLDDEDIGRDEFGCWEYAA
jgi:hypothetical protein